MSAQENKQLVMRGYQNYKDKDIGKILEMCTDDVEWVGGKSETIPFANTFHGKQETAQYFALVDQSLEARLFEPGELIAEGDKVVVLGQSNWAVKANGETFENPWVHVFTIQNGKISRFQVFDDTAAVAEAFGSYQKPGQEKGAGPTVRH
ncbi:MAG: uncharacterized protein V7606_2249 [Burkholderiales bacterium]